MGLGVHIHSIIGSVLCKFVTSFILQAATADAVNVVGIMWLSIKAFPFSWKLLHLWYASYLLQSGQHSLYPIFSLSFLLLQPGLSLYPIVLGCGPTTKWSYVLFFFSTTHMTKWSFVHVLDFVFPHYISLQREYSIIM